jgi:hypothetical protein
MRLKRPLEALREKWHGRNERRSQEPSRESSPAPSTEPLPRPDYPASYTLPADSQTADETECGQDSPVAAPPILPLQISITAVAELDAQHFDPRQMLERTCTLA